MVSSGEDGGVSEGERATGNGRGGDGVRYKSRGVQAGQSKAAGGSGKRRSLKTSKSVIATPTPLTMKVMSPLPIESNYVFAWYHQVVTYLL